jgi:hypothetical protein
MKHRFATAFRRRLAITLIAIGSLAVVLFIVSQWFTIEATASHASVSVWSARITLAWKDPPSVNTDSTLFLGNVWFDISRNPSTYPFDAALSSFSQRSAVMFLPQLTQTITSINVPLWTLATLLIPGILLLYFPRPLKPNHCPHCRYNREGLPPNSPCPECGKPSTQVALVHNSSNARGGK